MTKELGFDSQQRIEILFFILFRLALGPTSCTLGTRCFPRNEVVKGKGKAVPVIGHGVP
jgi:hypothetical protein